MKLTNNHGLPEIMYRALTGGVSSEIGEFDLGWSRGEISVTTLVKPVRLAVLEARHSDEIEEDVADRLWLLMGSGVHSAIERVRMSNSLKEVSLNIRRNVGPKNWPWTVRGRFDIATPGELIDWKVGSVWSYIFMRPSDHEPQTNLYRLMAYEVWGLNFAQLKVWLIMRDWMEREAMSDPKYPRIPFAEINVGIWGRGETEDWLLNRLEILDEACEVADNDLPLCTVEETWEKAGVWAVTKKGQKKALRLMPTEEKAKEWMMGNAGDTITYRPGERTRCERYCRAAAFCSQFAEYTREVQNGRKGD